MIEIECVRCHHNIDDYERVSLVLVESEMLPVHDTCELANDVHEYIRLNEITEDGLITMLYTLITLKDQQHVLMQENANIRAEKEGMRREIITMNEKLSSLTAERDIAIQRYEDQRAAIQALWRQDATPV